MFARISSYAADLTKLVVPWTTFTACAVLTGGDIVLLVITPDYDAVRETTSQLMSPDARYSAPARIILGLFAVLLVPFALVLHGRLNGRPSARKLAVTSIWIHIAAALVTAVAMNDSDAKVIGDVSANDIHDHAALVAFGAAISVIIGTHFGYRPNQKFRGHRLQHYTTILTLVVLAIVSSIFVAELRTETNGVQERIILWSIITWLSITAWSWRKADAAR